MERLLVIKIDAGATTCASDPGKHCRFLGTYRMGLQPVCLLFPSAQDSHIELWDENGGVTGWLQRHKECIAAEKAGNLETCV